MLHPGFISTDQEARFSLYDWDAVRSPYKVASTKVDRPITYTSDSGENIRKTNLLRVPPPSFLMKIFFFIQFFFIVLLDRPEDALSNSVWTTSVGFAVVEIFHFYWMSILSKIVFFFHSMKTMINVFLFDFAILYGQKTIRKSDIDASTWSIRMSYTKSHMDKYGYVFFSVLSRNMRKRIERCPHKFICVLKVYHCDFRSYKRRFSH